MDAAPTSDRDREVFERYEIIDRIGAGGFGAVFRAHDRKYDRPVAIKVINLEQDDDDPADTRARFMREIRVTASVRSNHVVRLYNAGFYQGQPFLAMEFVDGTSLGQVIRQARRLHPKHGPRVCRAIASGLAAIHARGLVHRDIKPDNILVGRDGVIKIIDFGLAKFHRELEERSMAGLTMENTVLGSPHYISPEAAQDATSAGPPADIYSFGATMMHVLSGETLFPGDQPVRIMMAHLQEPPPSLADRDPQAHPILVKALAACLRKKPERRPSSVKLLEAFKRIR